MFSRSSPWQNRGKFLRTSEDWNGHTGHDHGEVDVHIGPCTPTTPKIPKGSSSLAHLPTLFYSWKTVFTRWSEEVRGGTTMENWYDKDAVWTDARARRSVFQKIKCSHASVPDQIVRYLHLFWVEEKSDQISAKETFDLNVGRNRRGTNEIWIA